MEGLVLPVLLFALACLVLALMSGAGRGVVAACQQAWDDRRIRKLLQLELPPSHYTVLHHVELPGDREPLLVDHLVVSVYGIFVIKQDSRSGRISGKPGDARWQRSNFLGQKQFANPLFECVSQVKALRLLLGLDASLLNFVMVFTGTVEFLNPMPVNVTRLDGLPLFIEGKDKLLIDFDQLPLLVGRIRAAQPGAGVLRQAAQPASR
jgi:hypothetical protein